MASEACKHAHISLNLLTLTDELQICVQRLCHFTFLSGQCRISSLVLWTICWEWLCGSVPILLFNYQVCGSLAPLTQLELKQDIVGLTEAPCLAFSSVIINTLYVHNYQPSALVFKFTFGFIIHSVPA